MIYNAVHLYFVRPLFDFPLMYEQQMEKMLSSKWRTEN